jgi:hypothetical protein
MVKKPGHEEERFARDAQASPELVLYLKRTSILAFARAFGRRKAEKFLRAWAQVIAEDQAIEAMLPLRPSSVRREEKAIKDAGAAWLREELPHLFASLPPE